jgi:YVTN family beta-propeller protein
LRSPDGKTVYVTNSNSATVTPITVATNTPGSPISMHGTPDQDDNRSGATVERRRRGFALAGQVCWDVDAL